MKKKRMKLLVICLLITFSPITPFTSTEVVNAAVASYEVSVTVYYNQHDNVTTTLKYSEYSEENNKVYSGDLILNTSKTFALGGTRQIVAVYEGTVYAN